MSELNRDGAGGMLVNRSMPMSTVIPVLVYADVGEAVEWLCDTFGFTERWRAGDHIAQLSVGEGAVVVTEQRVGQGSKHLMPPSRAHPVQAKPVTR